MNLEQEKKIIEEIKRRTRIQALNVTVNMNEKPSITDSKFGGVPYWDLSMEYPTSSSGRKLMLLAQFNLDKLNEEGKNPYDKLPKTGMLQFFIDTEDDCFGMCQEKEKADDKYIQDGYRVVYHKTINYSISPEEVEALGITVSTNLGDDNFGPICNEFAVDLQLKEVSMTANDFRYNTIFKDIMKEQKQQFNEEDNLYNILSDEAYDLLYDEDGENNGHWILGYPFFTQEDPRYPIYGNNNCKYNELLFQMDSDYIDNNYEIIWGDSGVCNFFIKSEDLAKADFTDVLYNWDCC